MQKFGLIMVLVAVIFSCWSTPVMADSSTISLQTPENGAIIDTLTPMFAWGSSAMADSFSIQVARDPNFQNMAINSSNLTNPTYMAPPGVLNHATYYWRVNSKAKVKTSGWSDIWVFTISKAASGTVSVNATLDSATWAGSIDCSVVGTGTTSVCNRVPEQYTAKPAGSYTLVFNGGGPPGASLSNITPSPTISLANGGIVSFTLNFMSSRSQASATVSQGSISVYAMLNGSPLSDSMNVTLNGPYSETLYTLPTSRYNMPSGDYYLTYNYGAPAYAGLNSIYPSSSQYLPAGGSITFTIQFNSTGYYPGNSYPDNYYPGNSYPVNPYPPPVVVVPPGGVHPPIVVTPPVVVVPPGGVHPPIVVTPPVVVVPPGGVRPPVVVTPPPGGVPPARPPVAQPPPGGSPPARPPVAQPPQIPPVQPVPAPRPPAAQPMPPSQPRPPAPSIQPVQPAMPQTRPAGPPQGMPAGGGGGVRR